MTEPLPPASDPYRPDPPVAVPQDYPTSPVVGPAMPYAYYPAPPPPRKKSKALRIVLLCLLLVFLLCGSAGTAATIWARNSAARPSGATSPSQATDAFLAAFYRDQDPARAKKAVCAQARDDKKIADQIGDIRRFASNYEKPTYTWSTPKISDATADKATVSVDLTMTTDDLKSSKTQLTLDAVNERGWWICGVHPQ